MNFYPARSTYSIKTKAPFSRFRFRSGFTPVLKTGSGSVTSSMTSVLCLPKRHVVFMCHLKITSLIKLWIWKRLVLFIGIARLVEEGFDQKSDMSGLFDAHKVGLPKDSRSRARRKEDDLLIFGYACKLFEDYEKAAAFDPEKSLIPWMGDESLRIDRSVQLYFD